jgi:hypothetical protein
LLLIAASCFVGSSDTALALAMALVFVFGVWWPWPFPARAAPPAPRAAAGCRPGRPGSPQCNVMQVRYIEGHCGACWYIRSSAGDGERSAASCTPDIRSAIYAMPGVAPGVNNRRLAANRADFLPFVPHACKASLLPNHLAPSTAVCLVSSGGVLACPPSASHPAWRAFSHALFRRCPV